MNPSAVLSKAVTSESISASPYDILTLNASTDLDNVVTLQDIVYEKLNEEDKNFLIKKSSEEIEDRMSKKGVMFGIFDETSVLVGYVNVALTNPAWPMADMVIEADQLPFAPKSLAIVQSLVVDPAHRRHKLGHKLVAAALEYCKKSGVTDVMCEIAAANYPSVKCFSDTGFSFIQTAVDPMDDCKLVYGHKSTTSKNTASHPPQEAAVVVSLVTEFDRLADLLAKGYHGHTAKRVSHTHRPDYQLTLSR